MYGLVALPLITSSTTGLCTVPSFSVILIDIFTSTPSIFPSVLNSCKEGNCIETLRRSKAVVLVALETDEELDQCYDALESCPVEAIGDDGED